MVYWNALDVVVYTIHTRLTLFAPKNNGRRCMIISIVLVKESVPTYVYDLAVPK